MTSEQREAAITLMFNGASNSENDDLITEVRAALDALLSEFVVLHRDDVTEEDRFRQIIKGGWGQGVPTHERRLVTRWEPTTNEDVGPWTTQETP